MIRDALAALRARRGRTLLAALGVLAASLVVGTSVTVGYSLATGFSRSAEQAQLPDVIARFPAQRRRAIDQRVSALPNLEARSYRSEALNQNLTSGEHFTRKGAITTVFEGRRGYTVVEGRDIRDGTAGEAVIERGVAREWDVRVGDDLYVEELGALRVSGIAVSPDNVAYPLASAARVYVTRAEHRGRVRPNVALLWLADPEKADVTLAQARAVTFGLGKLQFITRTGVEILLSQAAGIVISLLVAFSFVALLAAGTMLAAGAHADVQRRLTGLGVQRALGFGPGRIAAQQAVESALVAIPAAVAGITLGAVLVARPAAELLAALNELGPGLTGMLLPLAVSTTGVVALVVAAATWPAWRAARRPPVEILRGGDLSRKTKRGTPGGGLFALGVRFATAARGRWIAAVATIAVCAGVVTLMLALASLLERLREDPGTVGKRYQLAVQLDPILIPEAKALPGVQDVGERYSIDAADSFRLGEPIRLVAYPGDHTRFENPPLAEGRRIRGPNEVEVGVGMADALGLRPGSHARRPDPRRRRGALQGRRHRARARERRPGRLDPAGQADRDAAGPLAAGGRAPAAERRPGAGRARAREPRRAAAARRRRADRQRRVPRRARRGAARRRPGRRPRVPVRAHPGPHRHRPRTPRRRRHAARQRRGRDDRRPRARRRRGGRRGPGRDRRRAARARPLRPARLPPGRELRLAPARRVHRARSRS